MDRMKMRNNGDMLDEPLATADVRKQWESRYEGEVAYHDDNRDHDDVVFSFSSSSSADA